MNQKSYQALTVMLNDFPQTAADIRARLLSFDEVLRGVDDDAIVEAASRFRAGLVEGHNRAFAPSAAELSAEARRIDMKAYRRKTPAVPALPAPTGRRGPLTEAEKERQRQRMREFYRSIGRGEEADETTYREAMRAKYGDAIDTVPDAPQGRVPGFTKAA
jgi:hypothetical protein